MCKQTYLTGKVLCDLLVGADSSEASAFMIFQYVGVVQWWATLLLGSSLNLLSVRPLGPQDTSVTHLR